MRSRPIVLLFPVLVALGLGCSTSSPVVDVPLTVTVSPVPVKTAKGTLVEYELYIGRYAELGLRVTRVEVRRNDASGAVLRTFDGADASRFVVAPPPGGNDRAIVLVGFHLGEGESVPTTLHHTVTFADGSMTSGGVATVATTPVLVLEPPVRGSGWIMNFGPTTDPVYHRDAKGLMSGLVTFSERFAIDFIQLGPDGLPFSGPGDRNADWVTYGAELLAVASGTVVDARDGLPDHPVPGVVDDIPTTLENILGNYVVIDIGDRHEAFALYAHAMPGSVRVQVNDRVGAGQVIARLGNSGNSMAPHLHFHVCDGSGPLGTRNEVIFCNGLPYVVPAFDLLGFGDPEKLIAGEPFVPSGPPVPRTNELPLRNMVVRF